jgi:hypothetical protein
MHRFVMRVDVSREWKVASQSAWSHLRYYSRNEKEVATAKRNVVNYLAR